MLNELAMESNDHAVQRAIAAISQSDPLVKLVHQIVLGRIRPTDAGLQAVTASWLATYGAALQGAGLSKASLRRIDPRPRVEALVQVGVLNAEHPDVLALQTTYRQVYETASD
jgi:hypothetical protein